MPSNPVLPDYTKLTTVLNNSGVQVSNPALYQVIAQLIAACGQSQSVIQNLTPLIDPLGALRGDAVRIPLGVNVDGVTVTINGSNQLVAASGSISVVITNLNTAQIKTLNSAPVIVVPAIAGKIAVPVWAIIHGTSGPPSAGTPTTRLVWAVGSGFHALDFPSAPWPGGGGGTNIYVYNSFGGTFGTLPGSGGPIVSQPIYIENSGDIVGVGLVYDGVVWIGVMYV